MNNLHKWFKTVELQRHYYFQYYKYSMHRTVY